MKTIITPNTWRIYSPSSEWFWSNICKIFLSFQMNQLGSVITTATVENWRWKTQTCIKRINWDWESWCRMANLSDWRVRLSTWSLMKNGLDKTLFRFWGRNKIRIKCIWVSLRCSVVDKNINEDCVTTIATSSSTSFSNDHKVYAISCKNRKYRFGLRKMKF